MSTLTIPKFQRALLQPSIFHTNIVMLDDHPVPTPNFSANEHLILVHTTAITKGELFWSQNFLLPPEIAASKTLVPCSDIAGTVLIAPVNSPFPPGTEVYARANYNRTGCAREYTILLTEEMAERPHNLSWEESACVPMSAQTAWQALFVHAGLKAEAEKGARGKRVFVTAASGGVGVWLVQLAKWAGAEVVATCGAKNVQKVKALGADDVLDYKETDVKDWISRQERKVDVAIDCVGGTMLQAAWMAVKNDGMVISIAQDPDQEKPEAVEKTIKSLFFIVETNGGQLGTINGLIKEGTLKPAMDSVFPIDRFQEAFERAESGKASGKVVLDFAIRR